MGEIGVRWAASGRKGDPTPLCRKANIYLRAYCLVVDSRSRSRSRRQASIHLDGNRDACRRLERTVFGSCPPATGRQGGGDRYRG